MKKHRSLMKFVLLVLASGLAGGLASMGMRAGRKIMSQMAQDLQLWLAHSYLPLQLAVILLCGGVALVYYHQAKPLSDPQAEDRDFERGEKLLTRSMTALSVQMLLSFTLFGCYGAGLFWLMEEDHFSLWPILAFFASILLIVWGQVKQTQLVKFRNPEKRGDPLEVTFQKNWLDSCDEAERYSIYHASYHSYQVTNIALMVAWAIAVLAGMMLGTGLLPVLLVGALLATHTLSYLAAASRQQKSTQKRPGQPSRE